LTPAKDYRTLLAGYGMTGALPITIAASNRLFALFILQLLLSGNAVAQQDFSVFNTASNTGALVFTVFAERSDPARSPGSRQSRPFSRPDRNLANNRKYLTKCFL
jgi:hypothetical protein